MYNFSIIFGRFDSFHDSGGQSCKIPDIPKKFNRYSPYPPINPPLYAELI
jgi:hypothetical protein